MKKILFIVLFAIVLSFAKADTTTFIDPWLKAVQQTPADQDLYTFTYEDARIVGGKGILFAGKEIQNRGTFLFSGDGTFEFNNPTRSRSFAILTYNGANTFVGNPCQTGGDQTVQLDSGSCGFQNIQQPGLDFDLSSFHALAFNILYKDVPGPNRYGVRLWFKNGQTGFAFREYSDTVQGNDAPLLFFPLSEFGSAADISSGLAAFSVSIYNQAVSVDNLISAIQFFKPEVDKTVTQTGIQSPGNRVDFTLTVGLPHPQLPSPFVVDTTQTVYSTDVTVTDTLQIGFQNPTNIVVLVDNDVQSGAITPNGNSFSVTVNNINPTKQAVKITYSANLKNPQPECTNTVCNDVTASVVTSYSGSVISSNTLNDNECVQVASSAVLTVSQTCPAGISDSFTVTSGVSNSGSGPARSIDFTHTKFAGCTFTQITLDDVPVSGAVGTCNSVSDCKFNIGDISSGSSKTVKASVSCPGITTECGPHSFSVANSVVETCSGESGSSLCSFTDTFSVDLSVSESVVETVVPRPGDTLTFRITGTNTGGATLKKFTFAKTYDATDLLPDASWTCVGSTCSKTVETDLATGESHSVDFVTTVRNDILASNQETCNSVVLTGESPCDGTATTNLCTPLNPGSPDMKIEKSVRSTRYTYSIDWKSKGSGSVNNFKIHENLQAGWTLSQSSFDAGWRCDLQNDCTFDLGSKQPGTSGTVFFSVDVDPNAQLNNEKCWMNTVTASFEDSNLDLTNDNTDSAEIGSKCKKCCDPQCPTPTVKFINSCDSEIVCEYDVPEYWCPVCVKEPAHCDCSQCSNLKNVVFGQAVKK